MRVLVTGGRGFVGGHLVERLARDGHEVVALDRVRTASPTRAGVTAVQADVTDSAAMAEALRVHRVTHVVHAASIVGVAASAATPSSAMKVNITGALGLFDAVLETGGVLRLLDLSSEEVYGDFESDPAREDSARRPFSPYGISKLAVEQVAAYYREQLGLPYVAARLCWVYGPNFPRTRLPNSWLEDVAARRNSALAAGGDQRTDFTHIDDVVDALELMLRAPHLRHPAYNVATGVGTSVRTLAELLRRQHPWWQVSLGPGVLELAPGVEAAQKGALSTERIRSELGWQARIGLADGLARTYRTLSGGAPA